MTKQRELDQFYTNPKVAKDCIDEVKGLFNMNDFLIVEPSAGSGSFSDLISGDLLAMDLDPKKSYIKKQDFLEYNFEEDGVSVITIGNPPFGKNSSLAIKFFNKSAEFSQVIAMILPKTFKKDSVVNKLNTSFHNIKEIELEKNSFLFKGAEYDVPCVFQIWEKRADNRKKVPQKRESDLFKFVSKTDAPDFAIRRVGGLAGKLIEDYDKYSPASHYYIKVTKNVDSLKTKINNLYGVLNEKARNTAGNPSLSKHELIKELEK